eukprot:94843-Pelagomonas_calceolata.AAC.1
MDEGHKTEEDVRGMYLSLICGYLKPLMLQCINKTGKGQQNLGGGGREGGRAKVCSGIQGQYDVVIEVGTIGYHQLDIVTVSWTCVTFDVELRNSGHFGRTTWELRKLVGNLAEMAISGRDPQAEQSNHLAKGQNPTYPNLTYPSNWGHRAFQHLGRGIAL